MELSPNLESVIRRIASAQKRSVEEVVGEAVRDYGQRLDMRRDFIAEAEAAWSDVQATGRHVTGAEVAIWLEGWGTPDECRAPSCHD